MAVTHQGAISYSIDYLDKTCFYWIFAESLVTNNQNNTLYILALNITYALTN